MEKCDVCGAELQWSPDSDVSICRHRVHLAGGPNGPAARWTPGPWMNAGKLGFGFWITAPDAQIAVVYGPSVTPQAEANAKLIAAAPDLLAALKTVAPFMEEAERKGLVGDEGCFWPVELVRAAIQKAERG